MLPPCTCQPAKGIARIDTYTVCEMLLPILLPTHGRGDEVAVGARRTLHHPLTPSAQPG